ncbi:LysR family transcriptional regulator [Natronohydrobacter thiooxidans]|uniref:LysR family transcriptional regulator n=1 Tax=Natronohydrobacter thiooxidans TaxID=87172 RepID=UPI0008FF4806|nr:LysR family transcriptional regulator [Natronohydrobacter thiooxidans]
MSILTRLKPLHLRLLVAISEHGKLQRAAEHLAMSQPAASRILSEIEETLGTPLFERLPRGMRPTPLGARVLQRAALILVEYDALEKDIAMARDGLSGTVRIGAVTGPVLAYVMPAIRQIRQTAPDIEATIHVAPSVDLIRGLEDRKLDFIIARLPVGQEVSHLEVTPARHEQVALLVHQTHPLAGRGPCSLQALLEFDWVIQERGAPIRQAVENAFFHAYLPLPGQVTNSSSLLVALDMITAGPTIAPVAQEVANFLIGPGPDARLAILETEARITVEPYFVIRHKHHARSEATNRLYRRVLELL